MTNEIKKVEERQITDIVLNKVSDMQANGALELPKNYSAPNALKSAYLVIATPDKKTGKSLVQTCTTESVSTALLDMVVQGLNPSKKQCYFIPYGNQLTLVRSYLGTIALTKRVLGVEDVKGYAVYNDDVFKMGFDLKRGVKTIKEYIPTSEPKSENIIGAFAMVIGKDDILHVEYMSMEQIKTAWNQGQMKGGSPAHRNFTDQMAIKTVINRACKIYASSRDDSDIVSDYLQRDMAIVDEELENSIETNANKIPLVADEVGEEIETVSEEEDFDVDPETGEITMRNVTGR